MKITLALFTLLAISLTTCGGDDCTRESYLEDVEPIIERWLAFTDEAPDNLDNLASDDPDADQFIEFMANMTNIITLLELYEPPDCAKTAHRKLERAILSAQDAVLELMDDNIVTATAQLQRSVEYMEEWNDEVDKLP